MRGFASISTIIKIGREGCLRLHRATFADDRRRMPRPFRDVHTYNARRLRSNATEAESRLWSVIRGRRFGGFKFRRQYAIGDYVADFACIECGVIVELDGSQHAEQEGYDLGRSAWFESIGYRVVRIWNADYLRDPDSAHEAIWAALAIE